MGRKGSKLIPFLMDGLSKNKYNNLKFEDFKRQVFSLFLPQNTNRLDADCQFILKDWYKVKNRPYKLKKDYTEAKQGMEAALRKSDFLEVVHKGRNTKLIYRILNPLEIQAKKFSKKSQKKALKEEPYDDLENAPSPESSGYGSSSDNMEVDVSHALLDSLNHDHVYIWNCEKVSLNEVKQVEDFNFITLPLFPIENDALLQENGLRKIKVEQDENIYPMQLSYLEDDKFAINNEELLYESALPFESLENYAEPYENCSGDLDLVTIYPDGTISKDDSTFMLNLEDDKLVDEVITDWKVDLFADSEENSPKEISTSGFDIASCKTKVYECLHRIDMPDIIMLTCEPKLEATSVNKIPEENQDIYGNDADATIIVQAQPVPIDVKKSLQRNKIADKSGIQAAINELSNSSKPIVLQKDVKCDLFGKRIELQPGEEKPVVDYYEIGKHIALQLGQLPMLDMMDARTEIEQILTKYKNKVLL